MKKNLAILISNLKVAIKNFHNQVKIPNTFTNRRVLMKFIQFGLISNFTQINLKFLVTMKKPYIQSAPSTITPLGTIQWCTYNEVCLLVRV